MKKRISVKDIIYSAYPDKTPHEACRAWGNVLKVSPRTVEDWIYHNHIPANRCLLFCKLVKLRGVDIAIENLLS